MLKGVNDVQALSVVLGQYVVKVKADVVVVYVPKGLGGWATLELYQSDLLVDNNQNLKKKIYWWINRKTSWGIGIMYFHFYLHRRSTQAY